MQSVQTSRFGLIDVDEHRVIHFPEGLLGFSNDKDFALLEDRPGSPFLWLQSLDNPGLAFVLTNPFLFKKDYLQDLSGDERNLLRIDEGGEMVLFTLVSVPSDRPGNASTNLLGPLVIDTALRRGRQVVLPHAGYSHRHPLFDATPNSSL